MSFLRTIGECFTLRGKQQRRSRKCRTSAAQQFEVYSIKRERKSSSCSCVRLSTCVKLSVCASSSRGYTQGQLPASSPAPVVSLAQIHFMTFVAWCRLTFLLSLHCRVLISPRRQFSKMWLELGSMMQEDWNWPPDCSRETGNRLVTPWD